MAAESEAVRQLNICNSCRYCEGYCAVFPALERRTELSLFDVGHLSNLCHDCRACFYACMYAPPHEFGINLPVVLAETRRQTYDASFPAPGGLGGDRMTKGFTATVVFVVAAAAILAVVGGTHGWGVLGGRPARSPYVVVPYAGIIVLALAPAAVSVVTSVVASIRYWRRIGGRPRDLVNVPAAWATLREGLTLQYLRGGGEDCYYPTATPSGLRRRLHALVVYGFGLCLLSTIAAAVEQDFLGIGPPYPYLSVPVFSGLIGGIGLAIGCSGLLITKPEVDTSATDGQMMRRDTWFAAGLLALSLTGLATLFVRGSSAFGVVFAIHLTLVVGCFAVAPYTKAVHFIFRLLSLMKDNLERMATSETELTR
jgi:citrate/tricarballylate utilization protein